MVGRLLFGSIAASMDILFGLVVSFGLLLASVVRGQPLIYPLMAAIALFYLIYLKQGYGLKVITQFWWQGAIRAWSVFIILLLIGVLISTWLAAGTVPALVYYGTELIQPRYFVLSAFILTGLVSTLIGTSFGAAGTIGLALMILARGSDFANLNLVAGAIIAGAYVGDRCSPLSSSAHLIATITHTPIYPNLKNMMLTAWGPLLLSLGIYGGLSLMNPLGTMADSIAPAIATAFNLHWITLTPALLIMALAVCRVEVKLTMLASLLLASVLALGLQNYRWLDLLEFIGMGFHIDDPLLQPMLSGGGVWAMAKVCAIVMLSTGLAGMLAGTQSLTLVEGWLRHLHQPRSLFAGTIGVSLISGAFGCSQTISILLTHQLTHQQYERQGASRPRLAVDLENTSVVLSPLIPWNIAGLVPATVVMADPGFIPYAVYLYLIPLWNLIWPGQLEGTVAKTFKTIPSPH
ncbi:MAG: Na+/H+ antiporter NhaC family protein [Cyanobacteria bacterium J06635_1]